MAAGTPHCRRRAHDPWSLRPPAVAKRSGNALILQRGISSAGTRLATLPPQMVGAAPGACVAHEGYRWDLIRAALWHLPRTRCAAHEALRVARFVCRAPMVGARGRRRD